VVPFLSDGLVAVHLVLAEGDRLVDLGESSCGLNEIIPNMPDEM